MSFQTWLWIGFNVFVLLMLVLDLGIFHRKTHAVGVKEALLWSVVWISLALAFNVGIYQWQGKEPALQFLTGYLLEKSLSVDNLFVFLLIFAYFKVPVEYEHKVLAWGIVGALLLRALMIVGGAMLVKQFNWILYIFGGFLVFTGIKMAFEKETGVHPGDNPLVRLSRRLFRITKDYEGPHLFVRKDGILWATPLLVVVLVIESSDILFAVDSIPAIFGVTQDPFIVYTSNVFAILGLRALYFALAGLIKVFHYLRYGLSAVLTFIGVKMVIHYFKIEIPTPWALGVVLGLLAISAVASVLFPPKQTATEEHEHSVEAIDPQKAPKTPAD